jgi:hypothetical protein
MKKSLISFDVTIRPTSRLTRSTMSDGVPAGASSPHQISNT